MNWVDLLIIFILSINIVKSVKKGFVESIFNFIRFLLSIYLTKMYYSVVLGYIFNNPILYNGFKKVLTGILKVLFYSKIKQDETFLSNILSKGILNILINIICILITYFVIRWLLGFLGKLISHIFKAPVLKQLNMIGGLLFGIIKAILVIYIIFAFLKPIEFAFPNGFISKAIEHSLLSSYFNNCDLIMDFLMPKKV